MTGCLKNKALNGLAGAALLTQARVSESRCPHPVIWRLRNRPNSPDRLLPCIAQSLTANGDPTLPQSPWSLNHVRLGDGELLCADRERRIEAVDRQALRLSL